MGDNTPVSPTATLLIGVRQLDTAERQRLESPSIAMLAWEGGRSQGNVQAAIEALASRVKEICLHIDVVAMDPEVAPGVVDHPVPGGLSLSQMLEIIRAVRSCIRLRAACLATYTPEHDIDGKTLQAALRILETLAECALGGHPHPGTVS